MLGLQAGRRTRPLPQHVDFEDTDTRSLSAVSESDWCSACESSIRRAQVERYGRYGAPSSYYSMGSAEGYCSMGSVYSDEEWCSRCESERRRMQQPMPTGVGTIPFKPKKHKPSSQWRYGTDYPAGPWAPWFWNPKKKEYPSRRPV
uniref:Uncharacterized protein n=2 Tax=Eutreptiella gymnastica TaxID=73025 RepID=A0A6T2ACY9_9EUGL